MKKGYKKYVIITVVWALLSLAFILLNMFNGFNFVQELFANNDGFVRFVGLGSLAVTLIIASIWGVIMIFMLPHLIFGNKSHILASVLSGIFTVVFCFFLFFEVDFSSGILFLRFDELGSGVAAIILGILCAALCYLPIILWLVHGTDAFFDEYLLRLLVCLFLEIFLVMLWFFYMGTSKTFLSILFFLCAAGGVYLFGRYLFSDLSLGDLFGGAGSSSASNTTTSPQYSSNTTTSPQYSSSTQLDRETIRKQEEREAAERRRQERREEEERRRAEEAKREQEERDEHIFTHFKTEVRQRVLNGPDSHGYYDFEYDATFYFKNANGKIKTKTEGRRYNSTTDPYISVSTVESLHSHLLGSHDDRSWVW